MGVADMGGSIITGCDGNPLAVLATQMGLHMQVSGNEDKEPAF